MVGGGGKEPATGCEPSFHHSFYYDDASSAILQRYMAADIARFGYTLEKRPDSGHELMAG